MNVEIKESLERELRRLRSVAPTATEKEYDERISPRITEIKLQLAETWNQRASEQWEKNNNWRWL